MPDVPPPPPSPAIARRGLLAAAAAAPAIAVRAAAPPDAGVRGDQARDAGESVIGLFATASAATIPAHVTLVRTTGYRRAGIGAGRYILHRSDETPAADAIGSSAFRAADGRVFALAEDRPTPQMFGAGGDGQGDDAPAFAALLAYARRGSRACVVPLGTYRLLAPLDVSSIHDAYPYHSLDFTGEQMDGVVLLFDYDGRHALRINDAPGSYSGMAGARVGRFTVTVAPGRRIEQPVRVLNLINGRCSDIRVRADWNRLDDAVEMVRISAATQWSRFTNIVVEPYNAPEDARPGGQRATGISIGHGYRDVPLMSSAISNNSFHDCTVNRCRIGFLSEASDGTATYSCRMVACETGWIDRSSYATVHISPWDEGALRHGFVFDSARVSDPNGTAVHKTRFPQIVGGYVGSVLIAGAIGADIRCALNRLTVTAEAERCRALILGQEELALVGAEHDCLVERFDTTRRARIVSMGTQPLIHRWDAGGAEWRLDDAEGTGFSVYGHAGAHGHGGFREEVSADGVHLSYAWAGGAVGAEQRVLVRKATPEGHWFGTPLLPFDDSRLSLGNADLRWRTIHLATGPVVAAGPRADAAVDAIPAAWLDAWGEVRWICQTPRGGGRHAGLEAAQVAAAFARHGIAPEQLGLLHREPGRTEDAACWGLRYDQCNAMEAAWQRRELARLATRLEMLARTVEGD